MHAGWQSDPRSSARFSARGSSSPPEVVIARAGDGLRAHWIGDAGLEAVYRVQPDAVGAFVAAVTDLWTESGAIGTFGVFSRSKGTAPIPRWPPPSPGPIGDQPIRVLTHQGHDQMDHVSEFATRLTVTR